MRAALLLTVLPLALAHANPLHPAHHHHPRAAEIQARRANPQARGLLDGLASTDDDDDATTSAKSTAATISRAVTTTTASTISLVSSPTTTAAPTSVIGTTPPVSAIVSGGSSTLSHTTGVVLPSGAVNGTASISASATNSSTNPTSTSTSLSTTSQASDSVAMTLTTDAAGQTVVITQILTAAPQASGNSSAAAGADTDKKSDGGISTPAIIGICVGVGAVLLGLIGCAVWRMKRRSGDEDEAIRWPELNRHGDSSPHHALPARETGKHGFETSPLERSLSNSSSIFAPTTLSPSMHHGAPAMALNGSSFGAASSLEDEFNEKQYTPDANMPLSPVDHHYAAAAAADGGHFDDLPNPHTPGYPHHGGYDSHEEDYTNLPPPVMAMTPTQGLGVGSGWESGSDDAHVLHRGDEDPYGGMAEGHLAMPQPQVSQARGPVTF